MTPCLEWPGKWDRDGYGVIKRAGRMIFVHRDEWAKWHGPIPPGMIIMHTCDNPPCYTLDHLRLGTMGDNMRDMVSKGRNRNKTTGRRQEPPALTNGRGTLVVQGVQP